MTIFEMFLEHKVWVFISWEFVVGAESLTLKGEALQSSSKGTNPCWLGSPFPTRRIKTLLYRMRCRYNYIVLTKPTETQFNFPPGAPHLVKEKTKESTTAHGAPLPR